MTILARFFKSILFFLIAVSIAVFVHEAGHMFMAQAVGVEVTQFSIGFGKPLFSFELGSIQYKVCSIWLGGYVKINKESLEAANLFFRILFYVAGPMVNLVLAVLLLSFLLTRDMIKSLRKVENISFLRAYFMIMWVTIRSIGHPIKEVGSSFTSRSGLNSLSGPVGMIDDYYKTAKKESKKSWHDFWIKFASLNLVLFVVNLLPIPPFDGGKAVLDILRSITGDLAIYQYAELAGLVLIFLLFCTITGGDLSVILFRAIRRKRGVKKNDQSTT